MPWQNNTGHAESCSGHDISPSANRLAVERSVLGGHDGGRNEERNAGVINTRKALHEILFGNTAHRMPHATTDQTFASREKEDGSEEYIRLGRLGEIDRGWVEIECNCQNNYQADGMGPDVYQLVGDVKY